MASQAGGQSPERERSAVRLARDLGDTAVPLLARKLSQEDDAQASWAYFLLCRVGGERAVTAARALALDAAAPDAKKALALALLMELGAELPEEVTLTDPQGVAEGSVRELVSSLAGPAEVARAADLLLDQVDGPELPAFVAQMLQVAGAAALPLLDEFLLRDDVDPTVREALAEKRTQLTAAPPAGLALAVVRPPAVNVHLGEHRDGRRVIVVSTRPPRQSGEGDKDGAGEANDRPRLRLLVLHLDRPGKLTGARYALDLPAAGVRRARERLVREGFVCARLPRSEAAALIARAARRTRAETGRLPREYYLGRDLLGLRDEHVADELRAASPATVLDDLLARAFDQLEAGDAAGALPLAERFIAARPDDAEGRSCVAACLLELEQADGAMAQFAAAARLEPEHALRHWNLSHAAKRASKLGACYLALSDYLRLRDRGDGAKERTRAAKSYMKLFERYARMEHPDATPLAVARAEELFERAYQHHLAGRHEDAVTGFEAVLKLVPSHYPSWGNLGAAYLSLRRRQDAEFCLKKALEFRPDYEIARQNLATLRE